MYVLQILLAAKFKTLHNLSLIPVLAYYVKRDIRHLTSINEKHDVRIASPLATKSQNFA